MADAEEDEDEILYGASAASEVKQAELSMSLDEKATAEEAGDEEEEGGQSPQSPADAIKDEEEDDADDNDDDDG